MQNNRHQTSQNYSHISDLFYHLAIELKAHHFEFCAYVVEEAYYLYSVELEKRLNRKIN